MFNKEDEKGVLMRMLTFSIGLILVIAVVSMIMSWFFRNKDKEDEGFTFFYHKLTYRRKLVRTLWMIPLMIIPFLVIYWIGDINSKDIAIGIIIILTFLIQVTYNYVQWKRTEKNGDVV